MSTPRHSSQAYEAIYDFLFQARKTKCPRRCLGVETETQLLTKAGTPLTYEGQTESVNTPQVLQALAEQTQGEIIKKNGFVMGVKTCRNGHVSLEPGSQIELSTPPSTDLDKVFNQMESFDYDLRATASLLKLTPLELAVDPHSIPSHCDVIPLPRYQVMTNYLRDKGAHAWDMMRLTTSIQINIDYCCLGEAIEFMRLTTLLTPLSYALFANSPYSRGQKTNYLSYRAKIWEETDRARCGLYLPALSKQFSLEEYTHHIATYPLMFAFDKKNQTIPSGGKSLSQLHESGQVDLSFLNIDSATRQLFTESRLKSHFIEIRSVDKSDTKISQAASLFWYAFLDSPQAKEYIGEFYKEADAEETQSLQEEALKSGLSTKTRSGKKLKDIAKNLLKLFESCYQSHSALEPVVKIIDSGKNPAQEYLETM